ncbi:hypothetical protein [Chromatium okenii]|nr:hypothetical protein [Chromatium okenii]MBV5309725.1 hypothetical protein [Chromatium okenii]
MTNDPSASRVPIFRASLDAPEKLEKTRVPALFKQSRTGFLGVTQLDC